MRAVVDEAPVTRSRLRSVIHHPRDDWGCRRCATHDVISPAIEGASLTRNPFNPNSTASAACIGEVRSAAYKKLASSPRSIPRWAVGWTRGRRTYCAGFAVIRPSMCANR
jgi:hypothetical protein